MKKIKLVLPILGLVLAVTAGVSATAIVKADENAEAELDAIAEMNTKGMELDGEIKIDIDFEEPTL